MRAVLALDAIAERDNVDVSEREPKSTSDRRGRAARRRVSAIALRELYRDPDARRELREPHAHEKRALAAWSPRRAIDDVDAPANVVAAMAEKTVNLAVTGRREHA